MLPDGGLRGQPDAAAALSRGLHGHLGGIGVHDVAGHAVEADGAENLEVRQGLVNDAGPVVAAPLVGLEHDGAVARPLRVPAEAVLAGVPLLHVRGAVDVDVAHALEERVIVAEAPACGARLRLCPGRAGRCGQHAGGKDGSGHAGSPDERSAAEGAGRFG